MKKANITREQLRTLIERLAQSQYEINCSIPEDKPGHALSIVIFDDGSCGIGGSVSREDLQPFPSPAAAAEFLARDYEALEMPE